MVTMVLELALGHEVQPIVYDDTYAHYRVLIRSDKQPLGWISFSKNGREQFSPQEIKTLIKKQVGSLEHQYLFQRLYPQNNDRTSLPGISIVVCTRNRSSQLSNCLSYLSALKYDVFEIIVVDNAPDNDDTKEVAATFHVRYVKEERPGLDWARNRGISEANYDIVAFTDDDVRVDPRWLQAIGKTFQDTSIMGASGFVGPAELETPAQHLFELGYGGMGHGFYRKYFKKERLSSKQLLWASSFGIGANMAFRKEVFNSIGGFDTALDVGTPSHGAGDVEMFHRLVSKGHLLVYEPAMLVWHYHRRESSALRKQIFDNGRSFGCYLINCYRKKTVGRWTIIKFFLKEWLYKWNLRNLFGRRSTIPASHTLAELQGMFTSPFAYIKTKKRDKAVRKKYGSD